MYKYDKPRVAFIAPKTRYSGYRFVPIPPLGAVTLATILDKKGYDVRVYDESKEDVFVNGKLIDDIADRDVVGVSIISPAAPRGYYILEQVKKHNPKIKTMIGGPHVTTNPEEAAKYADVAVLRDAEEIIVDVVEKLQGVVDGGFVNNLDAIPIPDYRLIRKIRSRLMRRSRIIIPVSTQRGCPHTCKFCSVATISGRKIRSMSPERMFAEIEQRHREGYGLFFIVDDNYSIKKNVRGEFHELLIKSGVNKGVLFAFQDEVVMWQLKRGEKSVDAEYLDDARKAGCNSMFIGIESFNMEERKRIGKKGDLDDVEICCNEWTKRNGKVHGFCMFLPHDTKESIQGAVKRFTELGIDTAQFPAFTPFAGSPDFKEMEEKGELIFNNFPADWERYDGLHVNFTPRNMSRIEFSQQMKKAWRDFYNLRRVGRNIRKWRPGGIFGLVGVLLARQISKLED